MKVNSAREGRKGEKGRAGKGRERDREGGRAGGFKETEDEREGE